MPAQVDAGSACVRLGDAAWPFELDCQGPSATLDVGGRTVRVRPLRWREKLALARFAHLGTELVEREQLRISLEGGPIPAAEAERTVLAALAAWLDAPGDEGMPLETRVLAVVTLEVCRAMGLTPADLDGRDAYEVEALWRVGAGTGGWSQAVARPSAASSEHAAEHVPTAWDGELTRILVVPDPEPDPETVEATGDEEPERAGEEGEAVPPGELSADGPPADLPLRPEPVEARPRRRPRDLRAVRDFAVLDAAAAQQPMQLGRLLGEPEPAPARAPTLPGPEPEPALEEATMALPEQPPGRFEPWPTGSLPSARLADAPSASAAVADLRSLASTPEPYLAPRAAEPEPDAERFFDELADRLERAAVALGIDLGA